MSPKRDKGQPLRVSLIRRLSVEDAREDADRVEAAMVGEIAEKVHADGYALTGWPKVDRRWVGLAPRQSGMRERELPPGSDGALWVDLRVAGLAVPRE